MGNRAALKIYDFTLAAGGSQTILVESDYFRVMTAAGVIDVIGDTFGTLPALQAGQGLQNTSYKRLTIRDASGAPNTGTILCSGDLFIDNRTLGSVSLIPATNSFVQLAAAVTNVSSVIDAANTSRKYLLIQNKDSTGSIYVNLTGAAATVANGIEVPPGSALELTTAVPTASITAIGSIANNPNILVVEA